jgi:Ion channel
MTATPPRHGGGSYRYGGVLMLVLAIAIFALSAPEGAGGRAVELLASGAALMVAVLTSRARLRTRRVAGAAVAVTVLAGGGYAALGHPHPGLTYLASAVLLAATGAVILAGLVRLVIERGVVLQAVLGALAVYILVGLTLSFVIGAMAAGLSGPFFAQGTDAVQSERVYYSFTVLTTTGFGDFTAGTRAGRALAVLEMLIGQLYLVTVIATLVGNLRHQR